MLLRKVSAGHIVYSPNHKAFVSLSSEAQLPFNAEEYASLMGAFKVFFRCIDVNITAFGQEITLFERHPTFQLT